QHALQAADGRDGAAVGERAEAFGRQGGAFGAAHHVAHVDLVGRAGQSHAAALAAHVSQQALLAEEVHHLRHVVLGHVEGGGDLGDGGAARGLGGEVDQHPQAVFGEAGEFHRGSRGGGYSSVRVIV